MANESLRAVGRILIDVLDEADKSLAKRGVQNHPDGTSGFPYARARSDAYRKLTNDHAAKGFLTWWDILLEEVYEVGAETECALLRAELLRVASVAALWIDCLDRREAARVAAVVPQAALEGSVEMPAPDHGRKGFHSPGGGILVSA